MTPIEEEDFEDEDYEGNTITLPQVEIIYQKVSSSLKFNTDKTALLSWSLLTSIINIVSKK